MAGWSCQSQLYILAQYVDNQGDQSALLDFVERYMDEEGDEEE